MTDGAELLVQALRTEDVSDIFGLPGLQLDPLVDALYMAQDEVVLHPVVHEQSATYMADGYARTSGRPGVAMVVPGPGMLNGTAGLATALSCGSPVLALVGQIRSDLIGRGFGALHEIPDQSGILSSLTKWSARATHPDEIPVLVHEAFRQLRSGIPGPVALEVPPDILRATTTADAGAPTGTDRPAPGEHDIAEFVERVRRAANPLIILGGGVRASGAGEAVLRLAEAIGCPVVQTRNARGAVDTRHPLVLDPIALRAARDDADLVVAIGTRLGSTDGGQTDLGHADLVMVNLDARTFVSPRTPVQSIRADAGAFAEAAHAAVRAAGVAPADRAAEVARLKEWSRVQLAGLHPQNAYLSAIRSALPDDGVFVSEYTQVGYVASVSFPVHRPGSFISPGYQGTLGYGFATALGAQVGAGDRPVVSVTGDGGFAWTLSELATARRERIPLTTVVFVDGYYANVRRMQLEDSGGRYLATELTNPDFTALAGAYGIRSESAAGPEQLAEIVAANVQAREPLLVTVPVGEFPSPWGLIDAL